MKNKTLVYVFFFLLCGLFVVRLSHSVYGYTVDTILMCDDVDVNDQSPIGVGSLYLSNNGFIHCWINFTDLVGPAAINFTWLDPEQNLYRSSLVYTVSGIFPSFSVNNFMKVEGTRAASKLGVWTVKVYVDGTFAAKTEFIITDYGESFDAILYLENELSDVLEDKDLLLSQYSSLQEEYHELLMSFDELTTSYTLILEREEDYNESIRLLTSENQELNESLLELQSIYNDLLIDSEENQTSSKIMSELENTRFFLLVVITLFLFLLILYFSKK